MDEKNKAAGIDVEYVAHLARMQLSPDEARTFEVQLNHILDHVQTLSRLDVEGVEPTAHAVPVHNVFREDVVSASLDHEEAMKNAPQQRSGLFIVPRILE